MGTELGKNLVNGALSTGVGYGVTELTGNQELGMAAGVLSSFAFGAELDAIDESLNISGLNRPKGLPKANNYADDFDFSTSHAKSSADVDIVRPNNFFDNQNFNNPSKISGSDYKNADYLTTNGNKYQYDFEARPVGDYNINHNKNYVTNTSQADIVNNNRVKNTLGDADDLFQVNSNLKMQDSHRLQAALEGADAGNSRYNLYYSPNPDISVRNNLSFIDSGENTAETTNLRNSEIQKNINKALRAPDKDIQLEGSVAAAIGDDVVGFQKKINTPAGSFGEIDVETSQYIIEVTNGKSSKTASEFKKYFDPIMNPDGKKIILYAPNLKATKIPSIENAGVIVIQNIYELLKLLGK